MVRIYLVVFLSIALGAPTATAFAQDISFLDYESVSGDTIRYDVTIHTVRGSNRVVGSDKTQHWIIKPAPNERFTIQQASNERYLDAHQDEKNDFKVVTRPQQADASQRWILKKVAGLVDTYTIQQESSRKFLDAHEDSGNDFRVVTRPPQGDASQQWILTRLGKDSLVDGTFTIQQKVNMRFLDAHESGDGQAVTRPRQGDEIDGNDIPDKVSFSIRGSNPNAMPISKEISGSLHAAPSTALRFSNNNIGYPCAIEIDALSSDGWNIGKVDVTYFYGAVQVAATTFEPVGWVDTDGCGNNPGMSSCKTVSRDVPKYSTPVPWADMCDAEKRERMVAAKAAATAVSPVATLQSPGFQLDQNAELLTFNVNGHVQNASGQTAKLVLAFGVLGQTGWELLSVNSGYRDSRGLGAASDRLVAIGSNSQSISEAGFTIPIGAFGLENQQQPYQLGVSAIIYIGDVQVAVSDAIEFEIYVY